MTPIRSLKILFIILALLGTVIPYYFLISHIAAHGIDISAIINAIATNRMSSFAWTDVIISAMTLLLFAATTKLVPTGPLVITILATVFVGVSAGLPLLFYFLLRSGRLNLQQH